MGKGKKGKGKRKDKVKLTVDRTAVSKTASGSSRQLRALRQVVSLNDDMRAWNADALAQTKKLLEALDNLASVQAPFSDPCDLSYEDRLSTFMTWVKAKGVPTADLPVTPKAFPGRGTGLAATRRINVGEPIVAIPPSVIMTCYTSLDTELGPVIEKHRALSDNGTVVLCVHVLIEKFRGRGVTFPGKAPPPADPLPTTTDADADTDTAVATTTTTTANPLSRFAPYLDCLPLTSSCMMFFTYEDYVRLFGSSLFFRLVHSLRSAVRHYINTHQLFSKEAGWEDFAAKCLSWHAFRWAFSVTMTRQNELPLGPGQQNTLCFIPLWDFGNHEDVETQKVNTGYMDGDPPMLVSTAIREFEEGEEVTMYYGPRPNNQMLQYSGFVPPVNSADVLPVTLDIEEGDTMARIRKLLIQNCGIRAVRMVAEDGGMAAQPNKFAMHLGADKAQPPSARMISVLRVLSMDKAELETTLRSGKADYIRHVSPDCDKRAGELLAKRCEEMLAELKKAQTTAGADKLSTDVPSAAAGAGAGSSEASASHPDTSAAIVAFVAAEEEMLKRGLEWGKAVAAGEVTIVDPEPVVEDAEDEKEDDGDEAETKGEE